MKTFTEEQTKARRVQLVRAQQLALNGEWDEAVAANQEILAVTPDDVPALNRLGKALSEARRYSEAYEAYSKAVALDPVNQIAQRNVARLEPLKDERTDSAEGAERRHSQVPQSMFIEEIGRSKLTELVNLAANSKIMKMTSGDWVELRVEEKQLAVYSEDGIRLGRLDARLASRLLPLIENGNRYSAAVTVVSPGLLRIIIRETYEDPRNAGRLSFPVRNRPAAPRAYTRDSQRVRGIGDESDFLASDDDDDDGDDEPETEEEETNEEPALEESDEEQTL